MIADKLVALAARYRIRAIYEWPEFAAASGLMSHSANRREGMRLACDYSGRILKGVAPAEGRLRVVSRRSPSRARTPR